MIVRVAFVLALVVALAGCGGHEETTQARVYFLRDGKVWPVEREVQASTRVPAAVFALLDGPTAQERALGFTNDVLATGRSRAGLAQLVYTMTDSPGVHSAQLDGITYGRADFERQTPSILVESPLAFQEVETPLRVTGTANTFEATFEYELRDSAGKVVDSNFVTATSGTGTRGTFDFTTKKVDDAATLVVFERSAADGSRINEVEIPLRAAR